MKTQSTHIQHNPTNVAGSEQTLKIAFGQRRRAIRLLWMEYTPSEIAKVIGVPSEMICASYIPAGCPHRLDKNGQTWIVGTFFREWLERVALGTQENYCPQMRAEPLIERANYQDVLAFLEYHREALQNDPETVRKLWGGLRHVLDWAGCVPFTEAKTITPPLSVYAGNLKASGKNTLLAPAMLEKIMESAKLFFYWALREWPLRYQSIHQSWADSLRPSREQMAGENLRQVEAWEFDDVLKVATLDIAPDDITRRRARAAICFLYLSGMRVTAFVTLPLRCVNIVKRDIEQNPAKGVITKNRKAAKTTLLNIPELLDVVTQWDSFVRGAISLGHWYTRVSKDGKRLLSKKNAGTTNGRRNRLVREMQDICKLAGVPYKSPHKLRHGHAIYGLTRAKTVEELKAISQNLMHASITVTDGIYGNLKPDKMKRVIATLGQGDKKSENTSKKGELLKIAAYLKDNPEAYDLINQLMRD